MTRAIIFLVAFEAVTQLLIGQLIPGSSCLAVMLIWRFMTYYLGLLIGAVVMMADAKREGVIKVKREQFVQRISQAKEELRSAGTNRKEELIQKIEHLEQELYAIDRHAAIASGTVALRK